MDKDVREKIHFKAVGVEDRTFGGVVTEFCNCGLPWPCPVLAVYEDAEKKNMAPPGLYEKGEHHFEWESGSMDYVVQFCMHCGKFKEDLEKLDPMPKCPGPFTPPPIESFTAEPGRYIFGQMEPVRPPVGIIWLCACGHLNRYVIDEQFCSGCRHENPVVEAVYKIGPVKHWPINLRKL